MRCSCDFANDRGRQVRAPQRQRTPSCTRCKDKSPAPPSRQMGTTVDAAITDPLAALIAGHPLELLWTPAQGRHIVAAKDIAAGEAVLSAKPFASTTYTDDAGCTACPVPRARRCVAMSRGTSSWTARSVSLQIRSHSGSSWCGSAVSAYDALSERLGRSRGLWRGWVVRVRCGRALR